MPESFKCPSCSAPLEYEGKTMQKCNFCGCNVIVPAGVMQNSNVFGAAGSLDFGDLSALKGKALKIAEIQRLIQSGNKIMAIKVFRETFVVGLKEAKDAVDAMERGKSVDISGMQIQPANVGISLQNAQTMEVVKKIGYTIGGTFTAAIVISLLLIFVTLAGVIYSVFISVNDAVENSSAEESVPVMENRASVINEAEKPSIALETLKFGGEGIGAGKFKDNRTIAVDPQGRIYGADYSGGRVQVFDANGNFLAQITSDTSKTVDTLVADRKGNLFVLEGYDVHRFKAENGESLGTTRVDMATDLAVGLDGKIYVSTRRGEIHVLDATGANLKTIQIGKDLNLDHIQRMAIDGAGNFYLLEGRNYAVFKLSPDGKLLTRFGGRSSESIDKMPKGMFYGSPHDLAIDSQGRLYVSQGLRISIFDANGNYLNDFKTNQAFGMAFNDADEMFVASRPFVVKYKLNF